MRQFISNADGGIDVLENDRFLVHLNEDDLKAIYEIQQRNYDIQNVRDRIPDWVVEQLEDDDYLFADFNSRLFSDDEISEEEIYQKILADDDLIRKIADEYHELEAHGYSENGGFDWWKTLNQAIENNISIKDVMGKVLCDKRPKELEVGRWRIYLIEQGDPYGTDSHKVPWKDEEPCIEFYDLLGRSGQQWTTGRFYVRDLVSPRQPTFALSLDKMVEQGKGLVLNPNRPEWTVTPGDLNIISAWLKAAYAKTQEKTMVADLIEEAISRVTGPMLNDREQDYLKD